MSDYYTEPCGATLEGLEYGKYTVGENIKSELRKPGSTSSSLLRHMQERVAIRCQIELVKGGANDNV